mmetsp:Transcript_70919/g.140718  ORF Transcript_70919/g.140718 Transcript_70919/m.140718 type:complete len:318 (+) Transcript_70919:52-1005(+)|eukprot:CAMPEP_0172861570 /NCGR_PEP_ID=MMETSP1075-20121228/72734_1 /TAXON_ID=2916 /ORGANISM="Ceratium fusus, Strain PA161109" /LENGTH=317 /DNA_ID=CAMNT_0013709721 /DNA_START=52 /DNA_END=1005 /DNA_ORIENTATION=+
MWLLCAIVVGLALLWRLVRRAWRRQITKEEAILVTGCDSGFGLSIAKALVERTEATVFAGYVTDAGRSKLEGFGERVKPLKLDVTQQADVEAAFQALSQSGKTLWGVVNNAGIGCYGYAEALAIERFEQNLNVNVLGSIRVTKLALPLLRKSKGRLVTMGSIGGRMGVAFGSAYVPTKAAQGAFQDCVRQEVHRFGVRCSLIEPGFFRTGMLHRAAEIGKEACFAPPTNGKKHECPVEAAYGSYAERMKRTEGAVLAFEHLNGGEQGVERVINAVLDALSTVSPRTHYLVGLDANIMGRVMPCIPSWIIDLLQTYVI